MHELIFADLVRPRSYRCFGLELRPYSIGHEATLLRYRNALLLLGDDDFDGLTLEEKINAARSAALICSLDWAGSHKKQKGLLKWQWFTRKLDYEAEIATFRSYLSESKVSFPSPSSEAYNSAHGIEDGAEKPGRQPGAPFLAQLTVFALPLCSEFGVKTVYDFPYALASALYFTSMEEEGRFRIQNVKELEEQIQIDKIVQEVREEELAKESSGLATPLPNLD